MDIDAKELQTLSQDLGRASSRVLPEVEKVVFKGAMNVKKGMQQALQESDWFKPLARSVDFDINVTPNEVSAEVGPKHGPGESGNLANIAYFGSSVGVYRGGPKWKQEVGRGPGKGGGTVDFMRPLDEERPKFEKAIGDVLKNVL